MGDFDEFGKRLDRSRGEQSIGDNYGAQINPTAPTRRRACVLDGNVCECLPGFNLERGARDPRRSEPPRPIPHPSEESRGTTVSPGVDSCEGMPTPGAGDASDSQHGRSEFIAGWQDGYVAGFNAALRQISGEIWNRLNGPPLNIPLMDAGEDYETHIARRRGEVE